MGAGRDDGTGDKAPGFLERLAADPSRPLREAGLFAVLAHPDDETIALGGQLARLPGIRLVHVTDGAPRGGEDARAHGFDGPEAYAQARRCELKAAVAPAGLLPEALIALGVPDQEASLRLIEIAHRLAGVFRDEGASVVFTHAFEGGHPDHDGTAFAVHAACGLLRPFGLAPALIEMPFYRLGPSGEWLKQCFVPMPGVSAVELDLSDEQRQAKQRMLAAHRSQAAVLEMFSAEVERFRPAPRYDFTQPPNGGRLLYEAYGWGMNGARWQALARAALVELGAEVAA